MRIRPAARVAVSDPEGRVLLFRFVKKAANDREIDYWSLPGGAVEESESFAEAAARELFEETGIAVRDVGEAVGASRYTLLLASGETVDSDERLYAVRLPSRPELSRDGLTETEQRVLTEARWWSIEELRATTETVYPPGLADMLARLNDQ